MKGRGLYESSVCFEKQCLFPKPVPLPRQTSALFTKAASLLKSSVCFLNQCQSLRQKRGRFTKAAHFFKRNTPFLNQYLNRPSHSNHIHQTGIRIKFIHQILQSNPLQKIFNIFLQRVPDNFRHNALAVTRRIIA